MIVQRVEKHPPCGQYVAWEAVLAHEAVCGKPCVDCGGTNRCSDGITCYDCDRRKNGYS